MTGSATATVPAEPRSDRRLLEGSEAIARAMVAAGCRFFAGYPMTPFTEVLEHMARLLPSVGGRLHERRERARSGRHGLGRGRHRCTAPRPARPDRVSR